MKDETFPFQTSSGLLASQKKSGSGDSSLILPPSSFALSAARTHGTLGIGLHLLFLLSDAESTWQIDRLVFLEYGLVQTSPSAISNLRSQIGSVFRLKFQISNLKSQIRDSQKSFSNLKSQIWNFRFWS